MPPRKPVPWINSKAKHMLREDILAGEVLDGMDPKVVYESRPEFQKFPYDRFRANLKSLHERIRKDRDRMEEDCEAYHADMSLLLALRDDDDAPEYSALMFYHGTCQKPKCFSRKIFPMERTKR